MSTQQRLEIVSVERIDGTEIVVEFSDRTIARYPADLLAEVMPMRTPSDDSARANGVAG